MNTKRERQPCPPETLAYCINLIQHIPRVLRAWYGWEFELATTNVLGMFGGLPDLDFTDSQQQDRDRMLEALTPFSELEAFFKVKEGNTARKTYFKRASAVFKKSRGKSKQGVTADAEKCEGLQKQEELKEEIQRVGRKRGRKGEDEGRGFPGGPSTSSTEKANA